MQMSEHERRSRSQRARVWFESYNYLRRRMDLIWEVVSKPVKFPAPPRRRREDREIPKAA
jgi:hypothetical protein